MMHSNKIFVFSLLILLFALPLLAACSDSDGGKDQLTASPTDTVTPAKENTITIGHITDKTGLASSAMVTVDLGLALLPDHRS
ncbi:MAG: hypothetical protein HOC20_01905 [Chloroflexi bacterium]|jgi:hypothetical protein|nr:hypothetical protein [Chloroflexota bacterium]